MGLSTDVENNRGEPAGSYRSAPLFAAGYVQLEALTEEDPPVFAVSHIAYYLCRL